MADLTDRQQEAEVVDVASDRSGTTTISDRIIKDEPVIRLAEENIEVSKVAEDVGGVQVSRVTTTYQQPIEELLKSEKVEVERVPLNQPVDDVPPVRQDGEYTIVPVVEEILHVERRLILTEEVRIRRIEQTEKYQDEVTLHKQDVVVTRLAPEGSIAEEPNDN